MEKSFLGSSLARNIQNAITPKRQNINNQIFFGSLEFQMGKQCLLN
jgi:hypothetical protein